MKYLALLLLLAACEPGWMQKCRDNGGNVESYNCRTHTEYHRVMVSSDPLINIPVPYDVTTCDHRCAGASPEAQK